MHALIGTELSFLRARELRERERLARGRPLPMPRRPAPPPPIARASGP